MLNSFYFSDAWASQLAFSRSCSHTLFYSCLFLKHFPFCGNRKTSIAYQFVWVFLFLSTSVLVFAGLYCFVWETLTTSFYIM